MIEITTLLIISELTFVFLLFLLVFILSKKSDRHSPKHVREDVQRIKEQIMTYDQESK